MLEPPSPGNTPQRPDNRLWDAVIIGAGPAGSATAIRLAELGWQVLLLEKHSAGDFKFGESLPPRALGLVRTLVGEFSKDSNWQDHYYVSRGNISSWEDSQVQLNDFFFTPEGYGLCVNRPVFDRQLQKHAILAGATLLRRTGFSMSRRLNHQGQSAAGEGVAGWRVSLNDQTGNFEVLARYLIDASGRRSVLAKSLGISREGDDRLFAFAQRFRSASSDQDCFTRLEAAASGWWYSNRLPGKTDDQHERIVVLHTDRDLPAARQAASVTGFAELLGESVEMRRMLKQNNWQPNGKIVGAPAGHNRSACFAQADWLAVGDAAQAYDPLSSQGIDKALRSGAQAAQLLHTALLAPSAAEAKHSMCRYDHEQEKHWQNYCRQHQYYYRSQPRWHDEKFWQRRQFSTATQSDYETVREAS